MSRRFAFASSVVFHKPDNLFLGRITVLDLFANIRPILKQLFVGGVPVDFVFLIGVPFFRLFAVHRCGEFSSVLFRQLSRFYKFLELGLKGVRNLFYIVLRHWLFDTNVFFATLLLLQPLYDVFFGCLTVFNLF